MQEYLLELCIDSTSGRAVLVFFQTDIVFFQLLCSVFDNRPKKKVVKNMYFFFHSEMQKTILCGNFLVWFYLNVLFKAVIPSKSIYILMMDFLK